uniref:Molybdenum cofactor sulfurtransferase n=1 Tax=Opuntia streptacantha TaxID=393608 RepID=A0A7C9AX35_OPUST
MQSPLPNGKENSSSSSKPCNCHSCCLSPNLLGFPNSHLDHQNSANIANSSTFHYDFATATASSLYPHTQITNPDSLPSLQESFKRFTRAFPMFLDTVEADQIRKTEYPHLTLSSHVCLDYSGQALFSFSQQNGEFAASSSSTPPSSPTHLEEFSESEFAFKLRRRIMRYLNVLEDEYSLFFAANQASAFGVMGESYPFKTNKRVLTVYDHENEAVEAMIERSRKRGARVLSAEFKWPKLKINRAKLEEMLVEGHNKKKNKRRERGLFVFPIQSRVSGARYSYQWMNLAQDNGWHVCLDATGLGPKDMDTLGLTLIRPDFIVSTFYRVFGDDPSGFACLFVKKSIVPILTQPDISSAPGITSLKYFVQTSGCHFGNFPSPKTGDPNDEIECRGLDHADSLGLVQIGTRTRCLINWLTNAMGTLSHPNSEKGVQLVTIYGPRVGFDRGPALAFNVIDWKGEKIDPWLVQKLADRNNISLGCGFLKHLGFSERYREEEGRVLALEKGSEEKERKGKSKKGERIESRIAVVTASIGFLTNFEDVYKLWAFVSKFLDADFLEKERWRYIALNQKTILV